MTLGASWARPVEIIAPTLIGLSISRTNAAILTRGRADGNGAGRARVAVGVGKVGVTGARIGSRAVAATTIICASDCKVNSKIKEHGYIDHSSDRRIQEGTRCNLFQKIQAHICRHREPHIRLEHNSSRWLLTINKKHKGLRYLSRTKAHATCCGHIDRIEVQSWNKNLEQKNHQTHPDPARQVHVWRAVQRPYTHGL